MSARKLPPEAVDRLFRRLVATYGRRFWAQWEGVEPADVKAVWARELGGYVDRDDVFTWAFENMPEQPPNAIEFRNLCRRAPAPVTPQIEAPRADPQKVAEAIADARAILEAKAEHRTAWADRILERHRAGEKLSPGVVAAARAAVGRMNVADPAET